MACTGHALPPAPTPIDIWIRACHWPAPALAMAPPPHAHARAMAERHQAAHLRARRDGIRTPPPLRAPRASAWAGHGPCGIALKPKCQQSLRCAHSSLQLPPSHVSMILCTLPPIRPYHMASLGTNGSEAMKSMHTMLRKMRWGNRGLKFRAPPLLINLCYASDMAGFRGAAPEENWGFRDRERLQTPASHTT